MFIHQSTLAEQVKQMLLKRIASGEWPPGMKVPAEKDLVLELGLSAGTIRKALEFLENHKFILRQQGRGTFVMDPVSRNALELFERFRAEDGAPIEQAIAVLRYEEDEATEIERDALELRNGARVRRFSRLRRARGVPFQAEVIALPSELLPHSKDVNNPELWISTTAQNCGVLLGDAEEKISIAVCPKGAARLLGLEEHAVVMHIRAVLRSIDGVPVRFREAYCNTQGMYYSAPLKRDA